MSKVIPTIYCIDQAKVERLMDSESVYSAKTVHSLISRHHDSLREHKQTSAKQYELLSSQEVGNYEIQIYGTSNDSIPHNWANLFPSQLDIFALYPNLAAFISNGTECYAISSGMGHTLFEQFIDIDFPLDVARRIMKPRMSSTVERDITGSVYGRQQQFRSSQLIVSSRSLGTVWQAIKGEVSDEVVTSLEFANIFEPDRPKIGVEAGSALIVRRSIDITHFPKLLDWLKKKRKQRLTSEQIESFKFLDGLKEVSPRKNRPLVEGLKLALAAEVKTGVISNSLDYDFSHKEFEAYQGADSYHIDNDACEEVWYSSPTATEVFTELQDAELLDTTSPESVLEALEKVRFIAQGATPQDTRSASLLNYLHGEIKHGSNSYFLIDGRYYFAEGSFLARVSDDFAALLKGEYFKPDDDFSLESYANNTQPEGDYNDSYISRENWLVGDRVLMSNVELADLINITNEKVYIVHNKIGFGASMRDVCSQILLSMQVLFQAKIANDRLLLEDYYDRIKEKHYLPGNISISKEVFVDKILTADSKDIVYVLGYAHPNPATNSSRSNIAKFETIKLCTFDSSPYGFSLKVVHTQR